MIRGLKKREKDNYKRIDDDLYASLFGLNNPEKDDLHKAAFKKAWETRNFEIDKYWQRSAFFWGFIVLIFGGYITFVTGESYERAKEMYLDFYMILLGIIFSFAWLFVILGSKRRQENWEEHIYYLEDDITGPLYKTLYYKGKNYYSVSRINKILAWVVILTWGFLLLQYFYTNYIIFLNIYGCIFKYLKEFIMLVLPLFCTIFCIMFMLKKGQTSGGELNAEFEKGELGAFYIKDKKNLHGFDTCGCPSYEGQEIAKE